MCFAQRQLGQVLFALGIQYQQSLTGRLQGGLGLPGLRLIDLQAGTHLVQTVLRAVVALVELTDPVDLLAGAQLFGLGGGDLGLGLLNQAQLLGAGGRQIFGRRLIEAQVGFGLRDPGFVFAIIETGYQLARFDRLVVGDQHFADIAGQLGADPGHFTLQIGVVGAFKIAAVKIPVTGEQQTELRQYHGCQQGNFFVLTHFCDS